MSGYWLLASRRDARPIPRQLLPAYHLPCGVESLAHETHANAKATAACQLPTPGHIVDLVMLCSKPLLVTWIGKNRRCSTISEQSSPKSLILNSHQRDSFRRFLRFCVFWESVGIIVLSISSISFAQPAIADPTQLKSRN